MWNPDRNIEQLIDNFFENYYKDTAKLMREVFDLYRSHHKSMDAKSGLHFTPLTTLSTVYWPRNIVDRAEKLIREALAVCDGLEDQAVAGKLRPRIEEELVSVELLKVLFYNDYGYDMNKYKDFVLYFEQKTIDMNISKYREHESMASFLAGKKNW